LDVEKNKKRRFYNPADKDCKVLDQLIFDSRNDVGDNDASKKIRNKPDFSKIENLREEDFFKLEYVKPQHVVRSVRSKLVSDSIEAIIAGIAHRFNNFMINITIIPSILRF
jgi:hypothetical protein